MTTITEIDENYYCSHGIPANVCHIRYLNMKRRLRQSQACFGCDDYHHKHPTREQYREEYGKEWKGAVYYHCTQEGCDTECDAKEWTTKEHGCLHNPIIVCACTPIGKLLSGWRPK